MFTSYVSSKSSKMCLITFSDTPAQLFSCGTSSTIIIPVRLHYFQKNPIHGGLCFTGHFHCTLTQWLHPSLKTGSIFSLPVKVTIHMPVRHLTSL